MYQRLLRDARFFDLLFRLDQDLAESVREGGCPCGGRLHQGHYRRKPRGGPAGLDRRISLRLSYCCSVEGCRRRRTPPSLRFLERKVFFSVVVLLVPVLREGPSRQRVERLQEHYEVSARTLRRWQRWWRKEFAESRAMTRIQGLSAESIDAGALPGALLGVFRRMSLKEQVVALLQLIVGPSGQAV